MKIPITKNSLNTAHSRDSKRISPSNAIAVPLSRRVEAVIRCLRYLEKLKRAEIDSIRSFARTRLTADPAQREDRARLNAAFACESRVRHRANRGVSVGRERTPLMGIKPQKETGKMKASILFGAGWENDSLEVLWRDAGRAFCRVWRDDAEGDRHVFIPIPSGAERPTLESIEEHAIASRQGGSYRLDGVHHWRDRHRKGTHCPRRSQTIPEGGACLRQCELCRTGAYAHLIGVVWSREGSLHRSNAAAVRPL